jgi:hypothetical protein
VRGFRRSQQPPSIRPSHRFSSNAVRVGHAGVRIGWWNTTAPGAALTFDRNWLRIESVRLEQLFGGHGVEVWIESARVIKVRTVGRWFSTGLIFDTTDGTYDGVIVWLFRKRRDFVVSLLAARGWPVAGKVHHT